MTKAEMKNVAKSVFGRYKNQDKVFVTSDGQAFFSENEAKNHKVKNRTGKELGLEAFLRDEVVGATDGATSSKVSTTKSSKSNKTAKTTTSETDKDAEKIISEVAEMETAETVQAVLDAENAGTKREAVIDACEEKLAELNDDAE